LALPAQAQGIEGPAAEAVPQSAPSPQADAQPIGITLTLGDTRLHFMARPPNDPSLVVLRFERFVHEPQWSACKELELVIDGATSRSPLERAFKRDGVAGRELVQARVTVDDVARMRHARQVTFNLCGATRRLTVTHAALVQGFVTDFHAQLGQAVPEPITPPVAPKQDVPRAPSAPVPAPQVEQGGLRGRALLSLGIGLLGYRERTYSFEDGESFSVSSLAVGIHALPTLTFGYATSDSVVVALAVGVSLANASTEGGGDARETGVFVAPAVYYLFPGQSTRVFAGVQVGVSASSSRQADRDISSTTGTISGAIGFHYFASRAISLSPAVSLGGASGTADFRSRTMTASADQSELVFSLSLALVAWL
jgi:hypothetical protein